MTGLNGFNEAVRLSAEQPRGPGSALRALGPGPPLLQRYHHLRQDSQGGSPCSGRKPSYADFHPGSSRSIGHVHKSDSPSIRLFYPIASLRLEMICIIGMSIRYSAHAHLINTETIMTSQNQDDPSSDGSKGFTEAVRLSAEPLRGPGRALRACCPGPPLLQRFHHLRGILRAEARAQAGSPRTRTSTLAIAHRWRLLINMIAPI